MGQVTYVDIAATFNSEDGKTAIFALNRDLSKAHTLELKWEDRAPSKVLAATVLTGDDLKAVNGFDAPQRVAPQTASKPSLTGDTLKLELPAKSYTVVQLGS